MKYIVTIVITFIVAFATSLLFELDFISQNIVRYYLVIILIIVELATGFIILKAFK